MAKLRQLKKEGKIVSISEAIRFGLALFFESKTYVSVEPGRIDEELEGFDIKRIPER
jgi:hypothetical protein